MDMTEASAVLARIDSMDVTAALEVFAETATMTFGNAESMVGRAAIEAGAAALFTSIAAIRHILLNEWSVGPDTIAETEVTYSRHDGRQVTIPAVTIWHVGDDGLITDYRVFADQTPVYAA
jgi:ketosteroid isomerase-like protein